MFSAVCVLTARHWMTVEVFVNDCICDPSSESESLSLKDSKPRWSEPPSAGLSLERADA